MNNSPILARIRAAGVLRVGTTGDYTPFSLKQPGGSYQGADIDMAHDLAERLGVGIEFISTVWVDLLDHFLADRFDIAMGGVTVTAPRAEKAFFSVPTFVDGKRPLARRTISSSDMPKCKSFDIVVVRSQTGPRVALVKVRSVEIVSGRKPWSSAFSIIAKLKWFRP